MRRALVNLAFALLLAAAIAIAIGCAYASGRSREMCEPFCAERHPNATPTWGGYMGKSEERRECESNCRLGGDLENY